VYSNLNVVLTIHSRIVRKNIVFDLSPYKHNRWYLDFFLFAFLVFGDRQKITKIKFEIQR